MTVLVPDEQGVAALSAIEGVRPVRYWPAETAAPLPEEAADAEVLVGDFSRTAGALALTTRLPKLRLVQLLTAGAEAWLDAVPDHVRVSTARGAHGGSTAEWALGGLIAIYRDLVAFDRERRAGTWAPHRTETLQDKRVLVIGAGDLGQRMARRLAACDAVPTLVGTRGRDGVRGADEVPGLLPDADAVVLMTPLTPATTRLVDADFLAAMPDGAVLVNAARGRVVDTDALVAELRAGRLRAALDVTDPEPLPAGHPLWTVPGLLLTPHVAGSVTDYRTRGWSVAAAEIARFAAGQWPHNLVSGDY